MFWRSPPKVIPCDCNLRSASASEVLRVSLFASKSLLMKGRLLHRRSASHLFVMVSLDLYSLVRKVVNMSTVV